jgi:hypothetical protein
MAHFWSQGASGWEAQKLDLEQYDLATLAAPQAGDAMMHPAGAKAARLIRTDAAGKRVWAVAVCHDAGVRVNGRAVLAGLCVLADRDEVRVGSGVQYFFSSESLAVVEELPPLERPAFCGRCRQPIKTGSPAVRCPTCGVWYNQSPELPCWTYADKCAYCGHPTPLDAGLAWSPEE